MNIRYVPQDDLRYINLLREHPEHGETIARAMLTAFAATMRAYDEDWGGFISPSEIALAATTVFTVLFLHLRRDCGRTFPPDIVAGLVTDALAVVEKECASKSDAT